MSKILTLSKKAIVDLIIQPEVSSEVYYKAKLQSPVWPGGSSGVTIGLGYDLGHQTPLQIQKDLGGILLPVEIERMFKYAGKSGPQCNAYIPMLKDFKMSWEKACRLFYQTSLRRYAKMAADVYPELDEIHPYEQTAIVGLVYNRGNALDGRSTRKEMVALVKAIKDDNDNLMASLMRQMKRLWPVGQKGLLIRREKEAQYIEKADTPIDPEDVLKIEV